MIKYILLLTLIIFLVAVRSNAAEISIAIVAIPPLVIHKNKSFEGASIDFIHKVEEELPKGYTFKLVEYPNWASALEAVKNGDTDVIFAGSYSESRTEYLLFTKPYLILDNAFFVRNDFSKETITGSRVAVLKNSTVEEVLKGAGVEVVACPTEYEGLFRVSVGDVEVAVAEIARASWYIRRYRLANVKMLAPAGIKFDVRLAVSKKHKELYPILDAAVNSVSSSALLDIQHKYIFLQRLNTLEDSRLWIGISVVSLSSIIYLLVTAIKTRRLSAELEVRNKYVYNLAHHDTLTELPNRRALLETLNTLVSKRDPFAVVFMDLDRFKSINDSHGHDVGDKVLVLTAQRLKSTIRFEENLFRIGGDEFVIIIKGALDQGVVADICSRVVEAIRNPFRVKDIGVFKISVSLGIALYPMDETNPHELLKYTDVAMYHAKNIGRDCFSFFDPIMLKDTLEKSFITQELSGVVSRKELEIYYQPQVSLEDMSLCGVEALLRWNHPSIGYIPPNRFIKIAEETGDIVPIGTWVFEQSCRTAAALELHVSINVSAIQLTKGDLYTDIVSAMDRHGCNPSRLELELTESVFLEDIPDVLKNIEGLGIALSIDDFGTGYSSLSYIKNFNYTIAKIKIDKSFIDGICFSEPNKSLVKAIIDLAKSIGAVSIAEGVETREQFDCLAELGCDAIQGFFISKPLPFSYLKEFIHSYSDSSIIKL